MEKSTTSTYFEIPKDFGSLLFCDRLTFIRYLIDNPFTIFCRDAKFWYYDDKNDIFYYHNPFNKTRNGWYSARGLSNWRRRYEGEGLI